MRGIVARTNTNRDAKNIVCTNRKIFVSGHNGPIKKIEVNNLITKMFVYSAIKISANRPPLYSTLNPETNSDSPSAKSNGVRFVSAKFVINQITDSGNSIKHTQVCLLDDIEPISRDEITTRQLNRISDILTS